MVDRATTQSRANQKSVDRFFICELVGDGADWRDKAEPSLMCFRTGGRHILNCLHKAATLSVRFFDEPDRTEVPEVPHWIISLN